MKTKPQQLPQLNQAQEAEVKNLLDVLLDTAAPKDSSGYPMVTILSTQEALDTKVDLLSAKKRNRRYGAVFSLAVIPGLEESATGPVSLPVTPTHFFDADNLEDLKQRLQHEVDKAIAIAKMSKEDPIAFAHLQARFMEKMNASVSEMDTPKQLSKV